MNYHTNINITRTIYYQNLLASGLGTTAEPAWQASLLLWTAKSDRFLIWRHIWIKNMLLIFDIIVTFHLCRMYFGSNVFHEEKLKVYGEGEERKFKRFPTLGRLKPHCTLHLYLKSLLNTTIIRNWITLFVNHLSTTHIPLGMLKIQPVMLALVC